MSAMAAPLVVCSRCDRHVRASDASCPFCGTERVAVDLVRAPAGRVAYRAAVVLAGAAALSACEKQPRQDPSTQESSSGAAVAVYGPPPMYKVADAAQPKDTPPPRPDAGKK
jgi:hypothetical protein